MSLLKIKKDISTEDTENKYWISFSDMMTAMLMIFILICMALVVKLSYLKDNVKSDITELEKANQVRVDILYGMKNTLYKYGISVIIDEDNTILHIPESTFSFESGKWDINKKNNMEERAKLIGNALYNEITSIDRESGKHRYEFLETVFIEGHSDKDPCNIIKDDLLLTNWELSALRAISLWQFWINKTEYGEKMSNLLSGSLSNKNEKKYLFSVSGYADTRPVSEGISEEEKSKNRRIDIRIITKQPVIKDLENIITNLENKK